MIERHLIKVFGTTYMVEIETSAKLENKAVEKVEQKDTERKVFRNCIKNSPLFKDRKEWYIKC